jgi:hypothetical protein
VRRARHRELLAQPLAFALDDVGAVALHLVDAHLVFEKHDPPPRLAERRCGGRLIVIDRDDCGNDSITLRHNQLAFLAHPYTQAAIPSLRVS